MSSDFYNCEGIPFNKVDYLLFTSDKLKDCIRVYKKYKCKKALFSYLGDLENKGFWENSLDVLNEIEVESLIVLSTYCKDFSAINNQKKIKELRLETGNFIPSPINFSNFPKLEEFRGSWSKNLANLFSASSLKKLTLWKYKSKTEDATELTTLNNLNQLHLIQSTIADLKGIEKLKALCSLELAYNYKLKSFGTPPGWKPVLKTLKIEACKSFDINAIPFSPSLKEFNYLNNGKIKSIKPGLDKMPVLEDLNFSQTELIDGDISYLAEQPRLNEIYFLNRRHYSMRLEDVRRKIKDSPLHGGKAKK